MSDEKNTSVWQRAADLASLTGIKPSDPAYGEVLGLALEQVAGETEREDWGEDIRKAIDNEREACAKIAENLHSSDRPEDTLMNGYSEDDIFELGGDVAAKLIRARGEVKATAPVERKSVDGAPTAFDDVPPPKTFTYRGEEYEFQGTPKANAPVLNSVDLSHQAIIELESEACRFDECAAVLGDGGAKRQLLSCAEMLRKRAGQLREPLSTADGFYPSRELMRKTFGDSPSLTAQGVAYMRDHAQTMSGMEYAEAAARQQSSPKSVLVGSIEYGINEQGIYRERKFGNEKGLWRYDKGFAVPVQEAMRACGFTAENTRVSYHAESDCVDFEATLPDGDRVDFPYKVHADRWVAPMAFGEGMTNADEARVRYRAGYPVAALMEAGVLTSTPDMQVPSMQSIQAQIDALPPEGGVVDVPPGIHDIKGLKIPRGVTLRWVGESKGTANLLLPSFDANGIPIATDVCSRCGGALGSRVAVCENCEPNKEIE